MNLGLKLLFGLDPLRIGLDAGHRADHLALRLIKMAHTLGAASRIDFIDLFAEINRIIRACRLADIAVNALIGDEQCHGLIVKRCR